MKTFLHIGCGPKRKEQTTPGFNRPEWAEIRLDIDPSVDPDVTGTMTDMSAIADGSMDALFSSHTIEHLHTHEVQPALAEAHRVLTDTGFAIITCPDLQSVCAIVAQGGLTEPAYVSGMGPITPLDILFGHGASVAAGNHFMAHNTGFTAKSLIAALSEAGFASVAAVSRSRNFDLWAIASKSARERDALRALASAHFPG